MNICLDSEGSLFQPPSFWDRHFKILYEFHVLFYGSLGIGNSIGLGDSEGIGISK